MPTYEFRCPDGHEFDHFFRSISASQAEMPCPVCGKPSQRRVSGGAGLVFKGSGFYITDYGKDGKKDQKSSSSSTGEKSTESKSEKKTDAPKTDSTSTPPKSTE